MAQTVTRTQALLHNSKQFFISLDQAIGCLLAIVFTLLAYIFPSIPYWLAFADETLSALSHRWHIQFIRSWPRNVIDTLLWFDKDHCKASYASELLRNQSPPEHRNTA